MKRPTDTLDKLENAVHDKLAWQINHVEDKGPDGKPLWDAKTIVALFEVATNYVIKKRGASGPAMGGKLGGE